MSSASTKIIQAAAGNAGEALYVEDVFSTYVYEGNGSTQTITNDIDLDGEGGLVWLKNRDAADSHIWTDTERGATEILSSDSTAAEATDADTLTAFNSDGFAIGADVKVNTNTEDYVSWTFRKAPKFFDVVTWTGNSTAGRSIPHNLGSVPGCIIVKASSRTSNWVVYHRSLPNTSALYLNETTAEVTTATWAWNSTTPTDTHFTVGSDTWLNGTGETYVAYLFAHNDGDGDFGETGDQDIIKCGSYTGTGSTGNEVNLGWEPQWILIKSADSATYGDWWLYDTIRGITTGGNDFVLRPNLSDAESDPEHLRLSPTGFTVGDNAVDAINESGVDYIYIAIRRGPMKTPESASEVFAVDKTSVTTNPSYTSGFPVDMFIRTRISSAYSNFVFSRMQNDKYLETNNNGAEASWGAVNFFQYMDGCFEGAGASSDFPAYMWRRAPGFFDVVTYGDVSAGAEIPHNLGVIPELMIAKRRNSTGSWFVYHSSLDATNFLTLNTNNASATSISAWNDTEPTDSVFTVGGFVGDSNDYIAYLFATLPGISKVGSYTGNGTSQTIDCGFSAGARFVLTKRTNTTGNWNFWDSERGIVAGNDSRLELNTSDAQDTGHDYIDPDSSGFVVNYVADDDDDTNVSGDTYIFYAIA